jgi:hypothetical protein
VFLCQDPGVKGTYFTKGSKVTGTCDGKGSKTQWATEWTLGEKSKAHFCKIQLVLDILRTMDYSIALKVLLHNPSRVENERIENN